MNTSDKKEDLVKQKTTTMKIPRMNYDSAAEIQRRRDCIDQQVEMKMRDKFYEQRKKEEQRQKAGKNGRIRVIIFTLNIWNFI